jgi:hypothetical protein
VIRSVEPEGVVPESLAQDGVALWQQWVNEYIPYTQF